MALVELVHPQGRQKVSIVPLVAKCDRFKNNPALITTPYRVQSGVSLKDFQDFVTALEDKPINIKDRNFLGLSQLSEEFGFQALLAKFSSYRRSAGLSDAQTAECRSRISALEERAGQHERQLAVLQSGLFPALRRFEADLARLASELEAFRDAKKTGTARPAVAPPPGTPERPASTIVSAVAAPPGRLESLIVSEYPPLFEEFRAKHFNLLWQGSRDDFLAREFHRRCDGRANSLTLIADTDGNVFGGFTPVKWESGYEYKGDDNLRSFLFTLRNPHGVPPRKFALTAEKKQFAISCDSTCCVVFGADCEIGVYDICNANKESFTQFGTRRSHRVYANDTGIEGFSTGAFKFTVKEIEVFEITD
jgi:hypothetical protein